MKLDVLVTTAHPDDAEFSMGGTILKLLAQGKKVGIADFTRGELGTRGTADTRAAEAAEADKRMNLTTRVNLGFHDGFFKDDKEHVLAVVKLIREFQPDIIFSNPHDDRHPDHGRAHNVVKQAVFLSGLPKIDTGQEAWRPQRMFQYIQNHPLEPNFVVDISDFWEQKAHVLKAYASQFYQEDSDEPETVMTCRNFWGYVEAMNRVAGQRIGALYGEGFISCAPLKINDVTTLI